MRRRMIAFTYKGKEREALELGIDERSIGCMLCYQTSPDVGERSFKVPEMRNVRSIKMNPIAYVYLRYKDLHDLPADYKAIPEYTLRAIRNYVELHEPCGDFLTAVFSNKLQEAFSRADDNNLAALRAIVMLVHNRVPSACHGSPEAVAFWLDG